MLKELHLSNIVLIDSAAISLHAGFNVLSGESGSGKSAIINALRLLAGERADVGVVRRGAEKGAVEAIFDINTIDGLSVILDQAGIGHEAGDELIVRREIFATGKSRAFINNQLAQLALLRQVADHLFEIIGQHANQKLLSLDYQRKVLDYFGSLQQIAQDFAHCWEEETKAKRELERLVSSEAQRLRDIEVCRMEIEELEDAALKDGEEESLFAEYSKLSNADELCHRAEDINRTLAGEKSAVLTQLNRLKTSFDQLSLLDPSMKEIADSYQSSLVELAEIAQTIRNYSSRIEHDSARTIFLNERLTTINRLKKKYGRSVEEINAYLDHARQKLLELESADIRIEHLQDRLAGLENKSNTLSAMLTSMRCETAKNFENALVHHLRELNMPKVEFIVEISPQKRTSFGDDKVEFFLIPNFGENRVSLRECASGGELSRIMLAMQALLAGKERTPTLIFDEVDANIGGETAAVVGEKLNEISNKHQVICITHFPQVAKQAKHHLQIFKEEVDGRTFSSVKRLDVKERKQELCRMVGGLSKRR